MDRPVSLCSIKTIAKNATADHSDNRQTSSDRLKRQNSSWAVYGWDGTSLVKCVEIQHDQKIQHKSKNDGQSRKCEDAKRNIIPNKTEVHPKSHQGTKQRPHTGKQSRTIYMNPILFLIISNKSESRTVIEVLEQNIWAIRQFVSEWSPRKNPCRLVQTQSQIL